MFEYSKTSNMGVSEVADYISGSEISENKMSDPKWRTYILKIYLNSAKVEIWRFQWLVITDPIAMRVKTKWRIQNGGQIYIPYVRTRLKFKSGGFNGWLLQIPKQ